MLLKDWLVTPLYLIVIYLVIYTIKRKIHDPFSRKIFIPAFTVKIVAGLVLGLIYQFYYQGGDTLFYFKQSTIISEASFENPFLGWKLLTSNGNYDPETFKYASQLRWYKFPTEFLVVKIAALCGIFTFNTYTSIAILFTIFSFIGLWLMFETIIKIKPNLKTNAAIAIFFIPSCFFWGSGLLKDSLMMGGLGFLVYSIYNIFISHKLNVKSILLLVLAFYILATIRIYLLLAFIPPALIWIFMANNKKITNRILRILATPVFLVLGISSAFLLGVNITKGNQKYDLSQIPIRTKINAQYLYKMSINQQGSAYQIGNLDGTYQSMFKAAPEAITVTLFRPWLWEASNPLMLISAIESFCFLLFTVFLLFKLGPFRILRLIISDPFISFCLMFTLIFAFAVGLNSFNFGTLVRYKIPLLPFFLTILFFLFDSIGKKQLVKNI